MSIYKSIIKKRVINLDFTIHKKSAKTKNNYSATNIDLAYKFSKEIHEELGDLVKGIILFGSAARKNQDVNDIDILLIIDDVSIRLVPELVQTYRIIVEKTVQKISNKLHVTSMKFTSFWEYIRAGDPIAINIIRDGYALYDTGFFEPIQILLMQGRIKPSQEALWSYFNRGQQFLASSQKRILDAILDLYWGAMDVAHSALMNINQVPVSPEEVPDMMEDKLVKTKLISKKIPWTLRKLYSYNKKISHGKIKNISGAEYDALLKETKEYFDAMAHFIKK
jgi:predicted nucleotidyltransferase